LLLGYWADGKLRYAGHAGSGLTEPVITDVAARAAKLARGSSPFADKVQLHRPTRWLAPELVAEVTFADWTPDGLLRAPVFLRLRDDISPQSVTGGPEPRPTPGAEVENAPAARSKGGSARSQG